MLVVHHKKSLGSINYEVEPNQNNESLPPNYSSSNNNNRKKKSTNIEDDDDEQGDYSNHHRQQQTHYPTKPSNKVPSISFNRMKITRKDDDDNSDDNSDNVEDYSARQYNQKLRAKGLIRYIV